MVISTLPLGADALWDRAVAYAASSAGWKAERVETQTEIMNAEGDVEKRSSITMKLEAPPPAEPRYQVESAFEDDKETTSKARRDFSKKENAENSFVENLGINPFLPGVQEELEYYPDREGYRFAMRHRTEKGELLTLEGTAVIDPDSGAPRSISYSVADPPKTLRYMDVYIDYKENGEGVALPFRITMDAGVKILVMEKRITVETRFDRYRYYPQPQN